jgi:hypothetical protein
VLLGVVAAGPVLPGVHGFATVADVPVVDEGEDDAVVAEALPVLPVDGVEPVVGEVEAVVLPVLVLFDGVQGATVEVVPLPLVLLLPVTLPGLVELDGVDPGFVVCSVPMEPVEPVPVEVVPGDVEVVPDGVEVVPGAVEVVPGEVEVVPCGVDVVPGEVVDVAGCDPMPGLGVTVPVVCAVAMPIDNANTAEANRIFRMNLTPSLPLRGGLLNAGKMLRFYKSN